MSRGPPHRYGLYGVPPYKRQRRLSEDDIGQRSMNYGPAFYDPPYARHQEVGLGEFNDFSSVSVEQDLKICDRYGNRNNYERSDQIRSEKQRSSIEGTDNSLGHQSAGSPSSPHSIRLSPRSSPHHSPRGRHCSPPPSSLEASQPLLISTSQSSSSTSSSSSSKEPVLSSSDESGLVNKDNPFHAVCTTLSQSVPSHFPVLEDKLNESQNSMSLLSYGEGMERKDTCGGPTVEAVSPSVPGFEVCTDIKEKGTVKEEQADVMSKDELLQGMEKVDREIAQVKQQINNLKKVQKQLEDEASAEPRQPQKQELPAPEPKPKSIIQIVCDENRKKAEAAHARLAKLGYPLPGGKPLYNQPSDLQCYHDNLKKAPAIKAKLVKYFQLRKQAKEIKNRQLCKEYKTLKQAWLIKMERHENNPKRKHKEAKLREFYEKVFPEIKKQREQTERFTRMGSRSNWGIVARSEAEFNEIVDNLNEQEANERHMRTLAVEPPPMLDERERRVKFVNRNGLVRDPLGIINERKHKNIWSEKERHIFKDKFIHNPKDFDLISSFLPTKSVADCILFYYQTKKKEHYKQLSRRHNLKKRRRDQFGGGREGVPSNKTRVGATECSAKGGSEGEEDLEEMTDSAEESEETEENSQPTVCPTHATTPTPLVKRPDHVETSRWSEKEIEIALQGLKDCGRDWEAIARRVITKTGAQCKNFYFNYKKKLQLELLVAEHESIKIQRSQQQQKPQEQPLPPQQSLVQQKDISNSIDVTENHESGSHARNRSFQPSLKEMNSAVSSLSASSGKGTTSVAATANTLMRPGANISSSPITNPISSLQSACSGVVPSHSPHIPQVNSSSTLFMPTPGVIASIGRSSPNVADPQADTPFRSSLPESITQDIMHPSRPPHPETTYPALIYPRAVDPSNTRQDFLCSSHAGNLLLESHPLNQALSVQTHHQSSTSMSSSNSQSTKGEAQSGSSRSVTSNPGSCHLFTSHSVSSLETSHQKGSQCLITHLGISPSGKPHSGESVQSNSVVFTPSAPSSMQVSQHNPQASQSPGIVAPQEKPHSQVSFLKEASGGHYEASLKALHPGGHYSESSGGNSILSNEGKRDIDPEMLQKPFGLPEPDIIVIDADEQKRDVFPHLETAEGKQASSMLRRLASAGQATLTEQLIPAAAEPIRPQSLPTSSGTQLTETRMIKSATPPGSYFNSRQSALNPPPPLIQMPSRDKKASVAPDLTKETPRPREGFSHKLFQEHYSNAGHEISSGRESPRHVHTTTDIVRSETERRTPVIETVDLTKEREVSTSSGTRPTSPVVTHSSSARDRLQAMAMNAIAETKPVHLVEKLVQKKREETHLPPRTPDPKLSVYERSEAIRKFTALGNVCVSASRAAGGEYPSHTYPLITMQTQHQLQVHPQSMGTASPPPYAYSLHVGHPMASTHHHPEHHFLVPVGVHQMLPHTMNGEDLSSQIKLTVPFARQYPQTASYFPAGIRSLVPTYQPMTVCGHRYPIPLSQERHALHNPLDVSVRGSNDISEQDLANPFVVKQARHLQISKEHERAVSPGERQKFSRASHSPAEPQKHPLSVSPKFPLASCSPPEPPKDTPSVSPEMKSHFVARADVPNTRSSPTVTYLSQIPSRPASVSEMKNRAAVIPELVDNCAIAQTFPDPQSVMVPSSQHSCPDSKEKSKGDKNCSFVALETLVDVAVAARRVPLHERDDENLVSMEKKTMEESTELQQANVVSGMMLSQFSTTVSATVPSSFASPSMSNVPRYGITTGLVPKPPPLMPITGMRPTQDGSNVPTSVLAISVGGPGGVPVSNSPKTFTSPPGRARRSVSPDGPPPLIPRSVISPTGSSQGPPPLIRDFVSPVSNSVGGLEGDPDSTVTIASTQEANISKDASGRIVSNIDQDSKKEFSTSPLHLSSSSPSSSYNEQARSDDQNIPRTSGDSKVRTIVHTKKWVDSLHVEMSGGRLETLQSSTKISLEEYPLMLPSPGTVTSETGEATSKSEKEKELQTLGLPKQVNCVSKQRGKLDDMGQKGREVKQDCSPESESLPNQLSPRTNTSRMLGSSIEEIEEGELENDDEVATDYLSSKGLHPRIRSLVKDFQSSPQPSHCCGSDSETLSAEESEVLPESSDEMFALTTMKPLKQPTSSCYDEKDEEGEGSVKVFGSAVDTSTAHMQNVGTLLDCPIPSTLRHQSESDDAEATYTQSGSSGLEDTLTSSKPIFLHLPDIKTKTPTQHSPSTFSRKTQHGVGRPDLRAGEQECCESLEEEFGPEIKALTQSPCFRESGTQDNSSEASPALSEKAVNEEWPVKLQSWKESRVVGRKPDSESTAQIKHSEVTPDSSATLLSPDNPIRTTTTEINIHSCESIALVGNNDSIGITAFQVSEETGDLLSDKGTLRDDACMWPKTALTERALALFDPVGQRREETNEGDSVVKAPAERGLAHDADSYSSSSDSHPPEISSSMDNMPYDGEQLPYPTFVGEFVPLLQELDSPTNTSNVELGRSAVIISEYSSVCDDMSEREKLNEPAVVSSPPKKASHANDALSEGEILHSQGSSESDDEPVSEKPPCPLRSSQTEIDNGLLLSQKEGTEDDQLSEGEILESDDEPTQNTSKFLVISSGGDIDTACLPSRSPCVVSSSQDSSMETRCYIPISPAPPESPSHESESDRASPLPSWPSVDNPYSSVMPLPLAARMPPFPYSTLSINVGSASSSARSSPVPQAFTVSMGQGSSPSSSSLLTRPQEPTPLLSDNYEPLSDDDSEELAVSSIIGHDKDST